MTLKSRSEAILKPSGSHGYRNLTGPTGACALLRSPVAIPPHPSTHVDVAMIRGYRDIVDIDASARKHGVSDEDMLHALRHHRRAFQTDDADVTMFIGPSTKAEPLEIGLVTDDTGTAIIHAMRAREKFLKGWWVK